MATHTTNNSISMATGQISNGAALTSTGTLSTLSALGSGIYFDPTNGAMYHNQTAAMPTSYGVPAYTGGGAYINGPAYQAQIGQFSGLQQYFVPITGMDSYHSSFKAYKGKTMTDVEIDIICIYRVPPKFSAGSIDQGHLHIWRECNEPWNDDEYLQKNMCVENGLIGSLNFFSQEAADDFMGWWNHYVSLFGSTDYRTSAYPTAEDGKLDGYFMKSNTSKDFVQQWKQIVKHIRDGAVQINNGWLFKSAGDAALYKLIGDEQK